MRRSGTVRPDTLLRGFDNFYSTKRIFLKGKSFMGVMRYPSEPPSHRADQMLAKSPAVDSNTVEAARGSEKGIFYADGAKTNASPAPILWLYR